MNNNHNIRDLDMLYSDAKRLISEIITDKIDAVVLKNIGDVINNINDYWRGQDANIQINKLIDVEGLLIDNRDILGNIAVYISMLVKGYRDAQNMNTVILPSFPLLDFNKLTKRQKINGTSSEVYMNNNLLNIIASLNQTELKVEEINNIVTTIKSSILDNWIQEDANRDYAIKMFDKFSEDSITIINQLKEIIDCINTSMDKYNSSFAGATVMPSLESMFDNTDIVSKQYTVEQQQTLDSIEKNFENNKIVSDAFNSTLIEEVKNDLIDKGIDV